MAETTNKMRLWLVPAADDPSAYDREYQRGLAEFYASLQARAIKVSPRMFFRDAVGGGVSFVGDFVIPLAQVIGPTLGVVLVAWLQGRSGRKVRLKFGDVDAEGGTLEEVEALLKRAAEFNDSKRRASENEPETGSSSP